MVRSRPGHIHVRAARPRRAATPTPGRHERVAYLDNLKVLLVAAIIAAHGIGAYSWLDGAWPYQSVREVRLTAVGDVVLSVPALPGLLFVMALFFLISGLITPASMSRKGPVGFARGRLARLGIPLLVWVLGIWPALVYAVHMAAGERYSYWHGFVRANPFLDSGPMWFVAVLLIFSLGYAGWRQWAQRATKRRAASTQPSSDPRRRLPGRTVVLLAVAASVATILIRPVFPFMSSQVGQLKLWQWPEYLALFGLGIVAAQRGWFDPMPDRLRRGCGRAALVALLALAALTAAILLTSQKLDVIGEPGLHWAPLAMAAIEGPLAVTAAIWLLGVAQRRLERPLGRGIKALARSSYGAFILQGPVLIGLMLVLRPLSLPAEAKGLIVASAGVAGSFALAWVLVTRTPVARIL
jgi:hypothetical protein